MYVLRVYINQILYSITCFPLQIGWSNDLQALGARNCMVGSTRGRKEIPLDLVVNAMWSTKGAR